MKRNRYKPKVIRQDEVLDRMAEIEEKINDLTEKLLDKPEYEKSAILFLLLSMSALKEIFYAIMIGKLQPRAGEELVTQIMNTAKVLSALEIMEEENGSE